MAKSEPKKLQLEVQLPETGFKRRLFVNRFRVKHEKDFCFLQFGLHTSEGTLNEYTCVLPADALELNRNNLLQYLDRNPGLPASDPAWPGTRIEMGGDVVDLIGMTHRGEFAEVTLMTYSHSAAYRLGQEAVTNKVTLSAEPVVLLRMHASMQYDIIRALYENR